MAVERYAVVVAAQLSVALPLLWQYTAVLLFMCASSVQRLASQAPSLQILGSIVLAAPDSAAPSVPVEPLVQLDHTGPCWLFAC